MLTQIHSEASPASDVSKLVVCKDKCLTGDHWLCVPKGCCHNIDKNLCNQIGELGCNWNTKQLSNVSHVQTPIHNPGTEMAQRSVSCSKICSHSMRECEWSSLSIHLLNHCVVLSSGRSSLVRGSFLGRCGLSCRFKNLNSATVASEISFRKSLTISHHSGSLLRPTLCRHHLVSFAT